MLYKTVAQPAQAKLVVSRSVFIARAGAIIDENEAKSFLSEVKALEAQADHHCYAYKFGLGAGETIYYNDGGEPGGTAGRPILGAISAQGLSNTIIVVSRYFGGKKLGIPGLTEAYGEAALSALRQAGAVTRAECVEFAVAVPYDKLAHLRHLLQKMKVEETEAVYGVMAELRLQVPLEAVTALKSDLASLGLSCREPG